MKIENSQLELDEFAIISYSHKDTETVKKDFAEYNKVGISYWYDDEMKVGGDYIQQFRSVLDLDTCKGVIFFLSPWFFLSGPCSDELEYYKDKYKGEDQDKFALFVAVDGFNAYGSKEDLYKAIRPFADKPESSHTAKLTKEQKDALVKKRVKLFFDTKKTGELISSTDKTEVNYIQNAIRDGDLFHSSGIIYGHKKVSVKPLGFFPQKEKRRYRTSSIETQSVNRTLDSKPSYYAPVEWFVISEGEQTATYLSKSLLFAVDYLSLKHPIDGAAKNLSKQIEDMFLKDFKLDSDEVKTNGKKVKIKKVRFLSKAELSVLLRRYKKDPKQKKDILSPPITYFAQIALRKTPHTLWLAGDVKDAHRVDTGLEGFSEEKIGVELYYIRPVIEIELT